MTEEKLDFTAQFINQIKAKIAALQAILASVESASALGALGHSVEGIEISPASVTRADSLGVPSDLPEGAFLGKSVAACIELYLAAVKKKKTNKEIAEALRNGGVESKADDFGTIVTGSLFNLKKAGKVLRFKDGWGLAEWYPAHIRGAAPTAKRAQKKSKRRERKNTTKSPAVASEQSKLTQVKTSDRILGLLRTKPEREYSSSEIAQHVGIGIPIAGMVLGQLRKSGKVKMSAPGMYAIGKPQLVAAGT